MALYSETVMDHFRHPRNVGVIENADGVGEVGNAKCGDIMKIYLKIENDTISDVKFETFGCASASLPAPWPPSSSRESQSLSHDSDQPGGCGSAGRTAQPTSCTCSVLAEEAIQKALEDYAQRSGTPGPVSPSP